MSGETRFVSHSIDTGRFGVCNPSPTPIQQLKNVNLIKRKIKNRCGFLSHVQVICGAGYIFRVGYGHSFNAG